MKISIKLRAAVLLSAIHLVATAHAQNPLPLVTDDFEAYSAGAGTLTSPWSMTESSAGGVLASGFETKGKAGYIGFARTGSSAACWNYATVWQDGIAAGTRPVVKFTSLVAINPSTNGNHDSFSIEVYNQSTARLVQLSFLGESHAIHRSSFAAPSVVSTGYSLESSTTYQVEMELDFRANTWSAKIGPTTVVSDQPMAASGVALNLQEVDFGWLISNAATPGNNFLYYDNFRVDLVSGPYPFIVTQPVGLVRNPGESATFEVTATGHATLAYQWKKDGVNIPDANAAIYTRSGLTLSDSGAYTVVVSNSKGSVTSAPASLTVASPGSRSLSEWGQIGQDGATPPAGITDWRQVAVASNSAGSLATLGIREDGTLHVWGGSNSMVSGKPAGLVARQGALGTDHGLAVKYDGTVAAWGDNTYGQSTVPADLQAAGAGVVAVAGGIRHSIALKSNGSIRGWGSNYTPSGFGSSYTGQAEDPNDSFVAIASGYYHNLAINAYGQIASWGSNGWGQRTIPSAASFGVKAIAAGAYHSVAVLTDGTVVAWGRNEEGQCNVPAGLTGVAAVAAGYSWTAAMKDDGTVVAWGGNENGVTSIPGGLTNVRAIAGGGYSMAAIFGNAFKPIITKQPQASTVSFNAPVSFSTEAFVPFSAGQLPKSPFFQWYEGSTGDLSQPRGVNATWSGNYQTPRLTAPTSYWVKLESRADDGTTVLSTASSQTAAVTLDPTPVVYGQTNPTTVVEGDSASISVTFGAAPPYTVQWFRDGVPVAGGVESLPFYSVFQFAPYLPTLEGDYHAVITNASGSAPSGIIRVETRLTPPDLAFRLLEDIETGPKMPTRDTHTSSAVTIGEMEGGVLASSLGKTHFIPTNGQPPVEILNKTMNSIIPLGDKLIAHDGTTLYALSSGESTLLTLASLTNFTSIGVIGNILYFQGADPTFGGELWRTDGTIAGTYQVADIYPGTGSSIYSSIIFNNKILLSAYTPTTGRELWISDGTTAGTVLLKDIAAGTGSSDISFLSVEGGKVFLGARDSVAELEPWVTDGTPTGTVRLGDLYAGSNSSQPSYVGRLPSGNWLFGANTSSGAKLFTTDGTPAGTLQLFACNSPVKVTETASGVFFRASVSAGRELYYTNGTPAGTYLVKDIDPTVEYFYGQYGVSSTPRSSDPLAFGQVGGTTLFRATTFADGNELWRTDGTPAGTAMLVNFAPGDPSASCLAPENPPAAAPLFTFVGVSSTLGEGIWKTDGTTAGTTLAATFAGFPGRQGSTPVAARWVGGLLYIVTVKSQGDIAPTVLWAYDPEDDSLVLLKEFFIKFYTSWDPIMGALSALHEKNGSLWFLVHDVAAGAEWWSSRGTPETTIQMTDRYGDLPTESSSIAFMGELGGDALFTATRLGRRGLWISDGESGETRLLTHISTSPKSVEWEGKAYFFGNGSTSGSDLWSTDGTPEGTVRITSLSFTTAGTPKLVPFAGGFVFKGATASDVELWFSDGTAAGTRLLGDLYGYSSSNPDTDSSIIINGKLIFPADKYTETSQTRSNVLVAWNGSSFSLLHHGSNTQVKPMGVSSSGVFFAAQTSAQGRELWFTDGTTAGTRLVKDIVAGYGDGVGDISRVFNNRVYFAGGWSNPGLYVSDGTSAGTVRISTEQPTSFVIYNGALYFISYSSSTYNYRLWVTDGTEAGTRLVTSFNRSTTEAVVFDGAMYFIGQNTVYRSNGTAGGTFLLDTKGTSSLVTSERLYIAASSTDHGVEPYVLTRKPPVVAGPAPVWQSAVIGEALQLEVDAEGNDLRFQWYRGAPGDTSQPVGGNSPTLMVSANPGSASYWVRISADLATTDSVAFPVEGVTQLEAWARAIEPPLAPGGNSPLDLASDSDADGRNALLEFAMGTNPAVPDQPLLPVKIDRVEIEGASRLAVRHLKRSGNHLGITYSVVESPDLAGEGWNESAPFTVIAQPVPGSGDMEEAVVVLTWDEERPRGFFKIKIRKALD